MLLGTICSVAFGQVLPAFTLIFGDVIDSLGELGVALQDPTTPEDVREEVVAKAVDDINFVCMLFAILAGASLLLSYVMMSFWEFTSVR